jgi:lysophospholipase L1-like esterase
VRNARYPDLGTPPDRRTLIWESVMSQLRTAAATGPTLWGTVKHYSYLARLPGYVREIIRQGHELTAIQQDGPYDSAADYFGVNVTRIVELGLEAGAAVVLSTPPSAIPMRNAPTDPVEKSYWIRDAGTTEAYRRRLADRLRDIAAAGHAEGNRVSYVSHALTVDQFLDDAHLTAAGNEVVAQDLVEAIAPFLPPSVTSPPSASAGCGRQ